MKLLPILVAAMATACVAPDSATDAIDDLLAEPGELPTDLKADLVGNAVPKGVLLDYIVAVSEANTERRDNDAEVRDALIPAIALLAEDFAANRPENEVELTRGTWKNIWDDALSIDPPAPIILDRANIYQVVEDGFYYNITNQAFPGPDGLSSTQYFLKGAYSIARPASDENLGELALNIVDLEFVASVFRPGTLSDGANLRALALEVDEWVNTGSGVGIPPQEIFGPIGQTGLLFNLYVDENVRIAAGIDGQDDSLSLFVLRRTDNVGELPAF